jgi:alkanesulfonate monooxygenase SsuD/methylene tetrahydromethanopterin reductase-like flavin-dependent oxidoreductase (luciferase family)
MRFGVYAGPSFPGPAALPAPKAVEYAVALSRTAQESGLDGVFVGQHYLVGPDIQIFQPLVMLAHILGHCPGLYVGTCIFLLPLHNPVDVAEQVAALDAMANGKFLFGVGRGYLQAEFDTFNVNRASSGRRLAETLRAVRVLWAEAEASFGGEFFAFEKLRLSVRPLSPGGPPVFMAADTVKSVARVPERGGDAWLVSPRHSRTFLREAMPVYKAALAARGARFRGVPMARDLWIADDRQAAAAVVRGPFEGYYHKYTRWGQPGERYDLSFDELQRDRMLLGSPDEVIQAILDYRREFGVEFMWFRVYWPGMPLEQSLAVIRRLGREVLPAVRAATGDTHRW